MTRFLIADLACAVLIASAGCSATNATKAVTAARTVIDVASPVVESYQECTGGDGIPDSDAEHEKCLKGAAEVAVKAALDAISPEDDPQNQTENSDDSSTDATAPPNGS